MTTNGVVDASAMIECLAGPSPAPELRKRILLGTLVTPQLFDIEVASVLRRMTRSGQLSTTSAHNTLEDVRRAPVVRCDHQPLLERIWRLRDSVSAYDAAYVALAEQFGVPLITCDRRLAGAHGHKAEIERYELS